MPSALSERRFWVAHFFIFCLFIIIGYQLIQLTIIRRPAIAGLAERQHRLAIEIPPLRGQILDAGGKEWATHLRVPSVYAVPRILTREKKEKLARVLSQELGLDRAFIDERLSRDKAFVWIKRQVSADEASRIRALKHPALGIQEEFRRFYPQGDLLAQVIGFTDIDNKGLEGLEMTLDHELRGRAGLRLTKRDALGREIKAFEIKTLAAVNGHRVHLTVDQHWQYLTERALDRAFQQWKAKGAAAVVMEARTGKILAMANRPAFNPNDYEKSVPESRRNRAITDMFEPGSIFKIVTAAAALNENKVTRQDKFDCENGEYRYGSKVLHDVHPYGNLSFEEVIVKSSNIGTVKIAARLQPAVFQRYIEAFGFGRPTGIDLPGEARGFTRPPSQWSKTSPYNIPIGQEVLVTALQMTAAMAVIANDGSLVQPYMIERIEDQHGVMLREKKPVIRGTVIRPDVAQALREILVRAVEEGTGKKARIPGVPAGGKTGTAQKILENGRGYSHSNFMSSFVGFAPAEAPQFVMAVVVDDPKPLYYGGTVAAPVFKETMEAALFSRGYVPQNAPRLGTPKHPPTLPPAEALDTKFQTPESRPVTSH